MLGKLGTLVTSLQYENYGFIVVPVLPQVQPIGVPSLYLARYLVNYNGYEREAQFGAGQASQMKWK